MNERIKELISQAGNLSFNEAWNEEMPPVEYIICTSDSIYTAPFIEKFAELIVRECIQLADQYASGGAGSEFDMGYCSCANTLSDEFKKRFGVE